MTNKRVIGSSLLVASGICLVAQIAVMPVKKILTCNRVEPKVVQCQLQQKSLLGLTVESIFIKRLTAAWMESTTVYPEDGDPYEVYYGFIDTDIGSFAFPYKRSSTYARDVISRIQLYLKQPTATALEETVAYKYLLFLVIFLVALGLLYIIVGTSHLKKNDERLEM